MATVPFDAPFTGYGAAEAPATATSFDAEVRARAAQMRAPAVPAAAGAVPTGPAAPITGSPQPFYAKPINVPPWLKTAGGFGMKALRGFGVLGGVATAAEYGGKALEYGANAAATAYAAGSNMQPNPAVQAQQPAIAPPVAAAPQLAFAEAGTDPGIPAAGVTAAPVALAPQAAARGTGVITNNQTGVTTAIDARGAVPAAAPYDYTRGSPAAAFFQGGAGIKRIAGDNAQKIAGSKLLLDSITKGAAANKDNAQAGNFGIRTQAAVKHLEANPGDFAGAGAIAAGRVAPGKSVFLPTMSADKVDVGNTATGVITRRTVGPKVTESDIQKTMTANKMTREQVEKRLRDEGRM